MRRSEEPREQTLVVSSSPLLCRRLEDPLKTAGHSVQRMAGVGELLRCKRQRPFVVCYVDARGPGGCGEILDCFRARPGERYVLIRGPWTQPVGTDASVDGPWFGCLREPFGGEEVVLWARRAATEARLMQGDRSLDEILYGKFKVFLQSLGPGSMSRFHDLVWERVERPLLTAVLEWTGGNQTKAARVLGIHRNTLRAKIRLLGIDAKEPAPESKR